MAERERTHSMGVLCGVCGEVLVPAMCSCGGNHGSTYRQPDASAAEAWPDHACFRPSAER